jgi:hypothetical protein
MVQNFLSLLPVTKGLNSRNDVARLQLALVLSSILFRHTLLDERPVKIDVFSMP